MQGEQKSPASECAVDRDSICARPPLLSVVVYVVSGHCNTGTRREKEVGEIAEMFRVQLPSHRSAGWDCASGGG